MTKETEIVKTTSYRDGKLIDTYSHPLSDGTVDRVIIPLDTKPPKGKSKCPDCSNYYVDYDNHKTCSSFNKGNSIGLRWEELNILVSTMRSYDPFPSLSDDRLSQMGLFCLGKKGIIPIIEEGDSENK